MKYFVLVLFCVYLGFAQGQVLSIFNKTNLTPIGGAQIVNVNFPESKVYTNPNGQVDVSTLSKDGKWTIRHPFYTSVSTDYNELQSQNFRLYLSEKLNDLDEVVVTASRFEEKKKDLVQKVELIRSTQLQQMNQSSTADVLANSGNVLVQKSQQGGGSPIIRGFETNRVLIVIDGVRMNNAIYRGGHLQNVITIDNSMLEKVEIAFGPSSAVYGSDALGGVMHFHTKSPLLATNTKALVKANAYARYFSAANGYSAHADINVGGKKFGSLTSFTFAQFGDLTQGSKRSSKYPDFGKRFWYQDRINATDTIIQNSNPNRQIGSGYDQLDVLQKIVFQPSKQFRHTLNVQYSTSSNIPRYDRLTESNGLQPKFAEWYYGPQNRFFSAYTFAINKKSRMFDDSKLILSYQNVQESRIDRRFNNNLQNNRLEALTILSLNVDFEKFIAKNEVRYGFEAYNNDVNSKAYQRDIVTDTRTVLDTRYPDGGSKMSGLAAYTTHMLELGKTKGKFVLSDGLRLSYIALRAKFLDKTFFPFPFSEITQNNLNLSGNLGFVANLNKGWRFTVNASTGFRAPNVDDLTKVFESVPGSVIVPNPNLRAEYTYNGEIGVSKTIKEKISISAIGYYTRLRNVINVQKAKFEGADSILFDGQMSQVLSPTNSGRAYVYGVEFTIRGELSKNISIFGTFNYTYGRILTDTTEYPLDHIAPAFGRFGITCNLKKFKAELFSNYSGQKQLKDYNFIGEDNFVFATPDGMPAWYTLNLRFNYQFNKSIGLQVACENLLDQNYRVFASNISAPGRNFIMTLRFGL